MQFITQPAAGHFIRWYPIFKWMLGIIFPCQSIRTMQYTTHAASNSHTAISEPYFGLLSSFKFEFRWRNSTLSLLPGDTSGSSWISGSANKGVPSTGWMSSEECERSISFWSGFLLAFLSRDFLVRNFLLKLSFSCRQRSLWSSLVRLRS